MAEFGDAVRGKAFRLLANSIDDGHFFLRETAHVGLGVGCQGDAFLFFHHPGLGDYLVECTVDPIPALRHRSEFDGVVGQAGDGHSALAV